MRALPELDPLSWRAVALHLHDPSAFAASCKQAKQLVKEPEFQLEWFAAHHRERAPDRPWQYAALTWQLHRHASPQQIAAFMLRFHEWRQQQQQQKKPAATGSSSSASSNPAADAALPAARDALQPSHPFEGYHSTFPGCSPLKSTARQAQQLLAKQRGVDALYKLCPFSGLLLHVYAAASHNTLLMQQLLAHKQGPHCSSFPTYVSNPKPQPVVGPDINACISTDLACCCAALKGGSVDMLRLLFSRSGGYHGILAGCWQRRAMLRYAVRYSNADCVQEVVCAVRAFVPVAVGHRAQPAVMMPQHLEMAAARTDPWAAGVMAVLLASLTSKQRKPRNMRPAYKAACSSGCGPVLALLLQEAAAAPQQQLPVLLEAAAAAGNLQVLQHLLLQPPQTANNNAAQQQLDVPVFDWSILPPQRLTDLLHFTLPASSYCSCPASALWCTSQQQQWLAAEDFVRLQVADLLWQVLVVGQGREAEIRQYLNVNYPNEDPELQRSWLIALWMYADASRAQWLMQRQLLPSAGDRIYPRMPLWHGVADAITVGDFSRALELFNVLIALPPLPKRQQEQQQHQQREEGVMHLDKQLQAVAVMELSIGGHLRRACAAGDAAAVAQLERLACFAGNVFSTSELELGRPILLRNLLGGFLGRAVTMGTLAEELGLPWQLLQRLFRQHVARCEIEGRSQLEVEALRVASLHSLRSAQQEGFAGDDLGTAAACALRTEIGNIELELRTEPADDEDQQQQQQQQQQQEGEENAVAAAAEGGPAAATAPQEPNAQLHQETEQLLRRQVCGPVTLADLRQQLLQRLHAGENSIPLPQQAQLGPLPLWQQCVLELASTCQHPPSAFASVCHPSHKLYAVMTSGMRVASGIAPVSQQQAAAVVSITPLQRLLGDAAFVTGPPVSPQPARLPWGRLVAQAAVELRQPQLLAWALQPEQQQRLWGSVILRGIDMSSIQCVVAWLSLRQEACSPIWCRVSRHQQQQQEDLQQLRQQQQQQQQPSRPAFAQQMADVAMLMLREPLGVAFLLSSWLEQGLRHNSREADVARAKAVLAAVAAAGQLPAGAKQARREALMRVLDTGDVDLLALFLCWANRAA